MSQQDAPEEYIDGFFDAVQKMQILLQEAVLGDVGSDESAPILSFLHHCSCQRCKFTLSLVGYLQSQHHYYAQFEQAELPSSEKEKQ